MPEVIDEIVFRDTQTGRALRLSRSPEGVTVEIVSPGIGQQLEDRLAYALSAGDAEAAGKWLTLPER